MNRRDSRAPSQRQLRVGEEVRHALAWVLERGEVHDPGLQGRDLTVTEVDVSPDLKNATVFIVPLGGGDAEAPLAALTRAKSFLRRRIADQVRLKYVPALSFRLDESFDQADRIETLLRSPEVARDLGPEADNGEDGDGT